MPLEELNNIDLMELAEEMVNNIDVSNEDVIVPQEEEEEVVPSECSDTDSDSVSEKKAAWTPSGIFEQPEYDKDDDECKECKVEEETEDTEIQSWQCTHKQNSSSSCPHDSLRLNNEGFFICVLCNEEM